MAQTQQERKAETRARLLAAAADLFADQGIDAVSVDAVAEAAGRTSGAVYAHFGSKQGLLLALLDSWKESVLTVLLAEVAVSRFPRGQLAAVWDNVGRCPATDVGRWSLLEHELWLRAARDPEVAGVLRARNAEARRFSGPSAAPMDGGGRGAAGGRPRRAGRPGQGAADGLAMQRRLEPGIGQRRPRRPGWPPCSACPGAGWTASGSARATAAVGTRTDYRRSPTTTTPEPNHR